MKLGKIEAKYVDHMGSDMTAVNAARASFGRKSEWLPAGAVNHYEGAKSQNIDWSGKVVPKQFMPSTNTRPVVLPKGDVGLIKFLARGKTGQEWEDILDAVVSGKLSREEAHDLLVNVKNTPTHWAPFGHAQISMTEVVNLNTARQRFKHTVGFAYSELSMRYVSEEPVMWLPEVWRSAPEGSAKQGSGGKVMNEVELSGLGEGERTVEQAASTLSDISTSVYNKMIAAGVAPEQARSMLGQNMMVHYTVTGSLYAWANAYIQRSDPHAQKEIQELAVQWDEIIAPLYPVSWAALTRGDY